MSVKNRFSSDVVVIGAGPAGVAAAVAAARQGLRTTLLEWHGYAGGTRTAVAVDTFYGFWTPGERAVPIVGGIGREIAHATLDAGAFKRENTYGAGPGVTCDTQILKAQLDSLLESAGVEVYFHAIVSGVRAVADGWRIDVTSPFGRQWTGSSRYVIDASGDATAARLANVRTVNEVDAGDAQGLTTIFYMGGVDVQRALSLSHRDRSALIAAADRSGEYQLPRHEGSLHRTPHQGTLQVNFVRLSSVDPADPAELTRAEILGRRQALEYLRFFRENIAGCENAYLAGFGDQIGVRESYRLVGAKTLTEEDVLSGRIGSDGIALCAAPIEDHHAGADTRWTPVGGKGIYSIPYLALVPDSDARLLCVGRCLSAEHAALASARNSAQAFATGEAAAYAVRIAMDDGVPLRQVDVSRVRDLIQMNGGLL